MISKQARTVAPMPNCKRGDCRCDVEYARGSKHYTHMKDMTIASGAPKGRCNHKQLIDPASVSKQAT